MKKVSIRIKGGNVEADYSGFVGKACVDLQDRIRPTNLEVESQELKPEYSYDSGHTSGETEKHEW